MREGVEKMLPKSVLVEADLFISYLTADSLEPSFRIVVEEARKGFTNLLTSSEVYDDVMSALRSQGVQVEKILEFVADMKKIPHKVAAVTVNIAVEALQVYLKLC